MLTNQIDGALVNWGLWIPDQQGLLISVAGCSLIALLLLFSAIRSVRSLNRQLRSLPQRSKIVVAPRQVPSPALADLAGAPAPVIVSDDLYGDRAGYIHLRGNGPPDGVGAALPPSVPASAEMRPATA